MNNFIKNTIFFGLILALIFAPVARGATRIWSTTILLLVEALLIFLWLWRANNTGGYSFKRTKLDYPIMFFAVLAIVSFIFSIYKHDSFYALIKLFGYIGIYYLVVNEVDHEMRKKLLWSVILTGTALSAYGISQYMGVLKHAWWNPSGFLASTYVNHNHFSGYLELVIPLSLAALAGTGKREVDFKLALVPLSIIMFAAFILAQLRGAWFSLTLSLFVMSVLFVRRGKVTRKNITILILMIIMAATFVSFGNEVISERLSSLGGADENQASAYTRFKIWQGTVDLIAHNPLIGCGIGDFVWAFPRFRPEGLNVTANFAHNDYLEMAAEMGILAPVIFIWMLMLVMAGVARSHSMDSLRIGCATGMLSLALHGLVDFNFHIPANMLLFTVYAAIVMSPSHGIAAKRGDDA